MPDFTITLGAAARPLRHVWEHTLGSGHATLALRADWQAQLARCHRELGTRHVRFHGILDDDVGTLVVEDGKDIYSFFNADRIWDFLVDIGMRPVVELSFMPWALASGPKTVFHYAAHVSPPRDYGAWATLIGKLARHWVDRYGLAEVRQWYFEVWNEPNLTAFWTGAQDDYFRLYRTTAAALKQVDAGLRVGGPVTAMAEWVPEFLDFCEKDQVPAAFVAKTLLEVEPFVEAYSYWTFSDIFEENYFPSVPFHGGFGLLNLHGIPKPAYRAFQLLHRLGDEQLPVAGEHATVDAWAARRPGGLTLLLTNFAYPGHPIQAESVRLLLTDAPRPRCAYVERVDLDHANAPRLWQAMGEPEYLDALHVERLQEASRLAAEALTGTYRERTFALDLGLPPLAVAAVTVEWAEDDATGGAAP